MDNVVQRSMIYSTVKMIEKLGSRLQERLIQRTKACNLVYGFNRGQCSALGSSSTRRRRLRVAETKSKTKGKWRKSLARFSSGFSADKVI